mmetsp:Transcript_28313/g.52731  ORF Transcript_28313/g.52731 Transcript_28313/m.52731 type:complete len:228 (+) Transcript_28313:5338-6021(+)
MGNIFCGQRARGIKAAMGRRIGSAAGRLRLTVPETCGKTDRVCGPNVPRAGPVKAMRRRQHKIARDECTGAESATTKVNPSHSLPTGGGIIGVERPQGRRLPMRHASNEQGHTEGQGPHGLMNFAPVLCRASPTRTRGVNVSFSATHSACSRASGAPRDVPSETASPSTSALAETTETICALPRSTTKMGAPELPNSTEQEVTSTPSCCARTRQSSCSEGASDRPVP